MGSAKALGSAGGKAKPYGRPVAGLDAGSSRLVTGSSVVLVLNSLDAEQALAHAARRSGVGVVEMSCQRLEITLADQGAGVAIGGAHALLHQVGDLVLASILGKSCRAAR